MNAHVFLLILIVLFTSASPASASENIRVAIADNQRTVALASRGGLTVDGSPSAGYGNMTFGSSSIGPRPVRVRAGDGIIRVNGRSYRGEVELRKRKNGRILVINDLDIEDYLRGVIGAEIPSDWEDEALKAQAVASRTYALYQKKASGSRAYDLVATVDGQVYAGRSGERETTVRAVRETEGIIITYGGEAIPAFYHSSCGGHTESAWELWGIDAPYLRGVDCDCQEISKYGTWEKRLSTASAAAALRRQGYHLSGITSVEIDGITTAGRVKQVAIRYAGGIERIPAEQLRAAVGYSAIPSVFFEIEMEGGEIVISGRGLGHGVGLCQWGARVMAQRGYAYKAILQHYYPGTTLMRMKRP